MVYMGSKDKIKKYIVPIIQELIDKYKITVYSERFAGGPNIIDSIKCETKKASDNSETLIELLKYVRDGGKLPEDISKELYDEMRNNKETKKYPKWFIGLQYLASYNGRGFDGGYSKTTLTKENITRNYYQEKKRNLIKQAPKLKGIEFECADYRERPIQPNTLIYCDIPYKDTKKYDTSKTFDYDVFWCWVRKNSKENIILVSEQAAPKDFICIWEQEIVRTQNNRARKKATEKLFIYKDGKGAIEYEY